MKKGKKIKLIPDNLEAIIIERNKKPSVIILKDHIKSLGKIDIKTFSNNERDLNRLKDYLDKFENL